MPGRIRHAYLYARLAWGIFNFYAQNLEQLPGEDHRKGRKRGNGSGKRNGNGNGKRNGHADEDESGEDESGDEDDSGDEDAPAAAARHLRLHGQKAARSSGVVASGSKAKGKEKTKTRQRKNMPDAEEPHKRRKTGDDDDEPGGEGGNAPAPARRLRSHTAVQNSRAVASGSGTAGQGNARGGAQGGARRRAGTPLELDHRESTDAEAQLAEYVAADQALQAAGQLEPEDVRAGRYPGFSDAERLKYEWIRTHPQISAIGNPLVCHRSKDNDSDFEYADA
ncbi:hypothetical protein B0H17DRAFT_144038 [Mycena rosella]|uniref:Uncharacterized protein n=1 Tax=Mycena rosella TaxID=1033263 RepID=A0AAD7GQV2_MYCRO|nr:hypothetical protein B0H17DRAFT_144038 [Mycena rosella]